MGQRSNHDKIEELVTFILKIPGNKIVTLVGDFGHIAFDISMDGKIGYQAHHRNLFCEVLDMALDGGAGMTIREFLPFKVKRKMFDGKEMWLPEKNIYGVCFKNKNWHGLDSSTVKECHETDAVTLKPLAREIGVHYKDFPCRIG